MKLFDYTCPHCRKIHWQLENVRRRYGDGLVVSLLPVPFNPACNRYIKHAHPKHREACDYAKLALAVWRGRPESFSEFHHWLMKTTEPPPLDAAGSRAAEILGANQLAALVGSEQVSHKLEFSTGVYHQAGEGAIPMLIIDNRVVNGRFASVDQLLKVLETTYGPPTH